MRRYVYYNMLILNLDSISNHVVNQIINMMTFVNASY